MGRKPIFKATDIVKSFPGVKALDNVSFDLYEGEVFGLVGENGAGKSTFIKVMSGIHQPDSGKMEMLGEDITFDTPLDALDAGISVVHQELNYIPDLTIGENIMLSHYPKTKAGTVDWNAIYQSSKNAMDAIHLDLDPNQILGACTVAEKQQVEIAKAIQWNAKIVIFDEPTSALNNLETENLLEFIQRLKEQGVCVIYITHKLEEIFEIADRIGVLRDGLHVSTVERSQTTPEQLIELMVGREIVDMYPKSNTFLGEEILQINNLGNERLHDISFSLREGEILGIYGLMGSGHDELAQLLFGENPATSGDIFIDGEKVTINHPSVAIRNGLAYVPSDRKLDGLVLMHSVGQNITNVHYQRERHALVDHSYEKNAAQKWVDMFDIKTPSLQTVAESLSGGNQQKVVLAKWMEVSPRVLLMVDPTRGIDVGSKAEIYRLLDQFCSEGIAVVMITSEMPELLGMSDRVLVMCEGGINGEFTRDELSQVKVVTAAIGGNS